MAQFGSQTCVECDTCESNNVGLIVLCDARPMETCVCVCVCVYARVRVRMSVRVYGSMVVCSAGIWSLMNPNSRVPRAQRAERPCITTCAGSYRQSSDPSRLKESSIRIFDYTHTHTHTQLFGSQACGL